MCKRYKSSPKVKKIAQHLQQTAVTTAVTAGLALERALNLDLTYFLLLKAITKGDTFLKVMKKVFFRAWMKVQSKWVPVLMST